MDASAKPTEKIMPRPGRRVCHETLLLIWINIKMRQFTEDPASMRWTGARALSEEKTEAALSMLRVGSYALPRLFKVRGENGPSYELLRKWRTEKPFKLLMSQLADEYLDGFINEYMSEIRILHESFDRDTKDSISRKHEALSVRWLSRMLGEANDAWGKVLYEKAFERIPAIIRKQKDPGVIGQLYLLLLICRCRWPRKLKISPVDGQSYRKFYHDFMLRLGQDWCEAITRCATDAAKMYAEAMLTYNLLLHDKLTGPIYKHDGPLGGVALLTLVEEHNFMFGRPGAG